MGMVNRTINRGGFHGKRMDDGFFGGFNAADQMLGIGFRNNIIHQEPDGAAMQPIDRFALEARGIGIKGHFQGLQHLAITAKGDNHIAIFRRSVAILSD